MKIYLSATCMVLGMLMFGAIPAIAHSGIGDPTSESRALQLQHRLDEINALDRTTLSREDKRVLRREVREIKKELAQISGGVYLSVGAIILIALLLILLL